MRALRTLAALAAVGLFSAGCSDSSGPGDGGGPPVTTTLVCLQPGGGYVACTLPFEENATFEITLESSSCVLRNSTVTITSPLTNTLTTDGCYIETGQTWSFPVVQQAGDELAMQIRSAPEELPKALRASGAFPVWTVTFEDGGDTDHDDLVFEVRMIPE